MILRPPDLPRVPLIEIRPLGRFILFEQPPNHLINATSTFWSMTWSTLNRR
jgi:hypothetical protein